jgi:nitrogen regulatory protein PII-like uncharacterized protein
MLGNRAIQVQVVKKPKDDNNAAEVLDALPRVDPEQIVKIAKDYTAHAAITIGAVVAANRLLKTACDIAVIAAKAHIR